MGDNPIVFVVQLLSYRIPIVVGYEKRDHVVHKAILVFFKLLPFQGSKSPRLPTWFIDYLGLLLHRSVRSYSRPPVLNDEPPK